MGYQRSGYPRRHLPRYRRHLHAQRHRFRRDDEKRYPAGARHTQVERQSRALGYRRLELRQESAGGIEDQITTVWSLESCVWSFRTTTTRDPGLETRDTHNAYDPNFLKNPSFSSSSSKD